MKYKTLGKSGLRVSELALGAMTFGEGIDWGADSDTSKKIFDTYANAGGNFIDTANLYTNGNSEKLVGSFVKSERDYFVVATKYVFSMKPEDPNAGGSHKKNLAQALGNSLKRMNLDYVDMLWVHAYDPYTPVEEVMEGLHHLIQQGKVLYIGISDAPAWWIAKANMLAEAKSWSTFVGLQIEYNLIERSAERELLPMAKDFGMGVTVWSPLASGLLTGKYLQSKKSESKRLDIAPFKPVNERNQTIANAVVEVAEEIGKSPAQVALNWLRHQDDSIIPIIGARKVKQMEDNLKCLEFKLSEEHLQELNEVSQLELGFPHDYLKNTLPLLIGEIEIQKTW
jgi:aryl-alcohol dehydrogenase-like predicted oxidoreductase